MSSLRCLRALDLSIHPLMDEATRLALELLALGRDRVLSNHDNNVPEEDRMSFLHPDVKPRAREIGELLHKLDPALLYLVFECELQAFPGSDQRELEYVWSGIGDFQA